MSSFHQRAGKTAPRFLQDLALYDPDHPPASGRNLLSEVPPVFSETHHGLLEWISPEACRHVYTSKRNQTVLLPPEQKRGTASKVSAICSKCRYHVQVVANYTGTTSTALPNHIHHLVYQSGRQRNGFSVSEVTPKGQQVETFHYRCSHPTCAVTVSVRMLSPLLGSEFVRLLTDLDLLKERTDEAITANPERFEGIAQPLPINVLDNLRTYIHNALHERQRSKPISAINKRFVVCFGPGGLPCKDLLEFLDFRFQNEGFWDPPQVHSSVAPPYQDDLSLFLDDIIHELSVLIDQRPPAEKKIPYTLLTAPPADQDLLHALEAANYAKSSRVIEFEMPGEPCYEDLGVVEDMSSELIVEAYHRQIAVNPARAPHYLKCLKTIGILRGGLDLEIIDQAVMIAYSEGRYTEEDVLLAYRHFGLDPLDLNLTDENIIAKFHAYLGSTNQEADNRKHLWRIGDFRKSEEIKAAAEDRVSTAEQALIFLGVEDNTPDDFIMTMYTAKINDSPSSRVLARQAVSLIADSRKSDTLRHFLNTGETGAGEMDVGDAYRLLQIPDRTVDDAAIFAAFTICVDEAPGQLETYTRALGIIAKDRDSPTLGGHVPGSTMQSDRVLSDWPVGLQNIGNTCYLNSLLQFYFTVKPYREMVLDFENNKTDLDEESLKTKKVGSRKVSKLEVERSQKFLRKLQTLFHNMITSAQSSVRPEQELARLTLISSTNEDAIRRRSTISGMRPLGLGEINGMPIAGPQGPPLVTDGDAHMNESAVVSPEEKNSKDVLSSDIDSEVTLVSENVTQTIPSENKENEPPSDEVTSDAMKSNDGVDPPNRPPPIPPRPSDAERERQLKEEVELGAQQDVTEVINNVLFQSECAIRPRGIAPDGEQLDQIKDLFYGRTKSYISAENGVRSKEEFWSDIKVDVATGPRDIYSAIDGAFDMQKVVVDGEVVEQYGSISQLPPILQIQVQRVQFDPVKKTSFKSNSHLELKETIYLDRYMDTAKHDILQRRRQCWNWKDKLRTLECRRAELLRLNEVDGQNMPALFHNTGDLLEDFNSMKADPEYAKFSIDIDPELSSEVVQLSQIAETELAYIEQEVKDTQTMISSQFADSKHLPYRLYAVFMHQGSVEFGHYYIYIYDFKKEVWRKYNDNEIIEVQNTAEIFSNQGRANAPTPYFLVYVNGSMRERLVDPVCREIVAPPNSSTTDHQIAVDATAVDAKYQADMDVDMDMEPPAYEATWTAGDHSAPSAKSTPTSPVSPTSIPLKRKGLEEEINVDTVASNPNGPTTHIS